MDFVYVCKDSLSGGLIEGILFLGGVKERLRLLLQAELGKGCVLQESCCWMKFLQIRKRDLVSDVTTL